MQSKLAERLHLRYEPAAILFSDEKPSDARTYPDGQWVCAAAMLSAAMRAAGPLPSGTVRASVTADVMGCASMISVRRALTDI